MQPLPSSHGDKGAGNFVFRPPDVLIVQDSDESARVLEEILVQAECARRVERLRTGGQACAYLCREEPYEQAIPPDLLILDLGSPTEGGHHFLRWFKENTQFEHIPVLVVAAADDQSDMSRAYRTRANGYLAKPINQERLHRTIRHLSFYWSDKS